MTTTPEKNQTRLRSSLPPGARTIGRFAPAVGAAPPRDRVRAQARMELKTLLRNGEQVGLSLIIPILVLIFFTAAPVVSISGPRIDFVAPGVLALAIMSSAFTGQAIGTGFERRYGVLKRLGATPLSRSGLLLGKTLAVATVEIGQIAVLSLVAVAMGWRPHHGLLPAILLLLLASAAFSGLGLLIAGVLRAEATLAAANLIYVVFLALGGVVFPLTVLPGPIHAVLRLLPISALTDGLRGVLSGAQAFPGRELTTLLVWAVAALGAAALTFRWE